MAIESKRMTVNRSKPPTIHSITQISLLDAEQLQLQNGVSLHLLPGGDQDVVSLQFILPAGRWQETKPLQALYTASLFKDGTAFKSSREVNEIIDFHGAHLSVSATYDFVKLQLVALTKHLPPLLHLLEELFESPGYTDQELEIKRSKFIEKLKFNQQKTEYLAQRLFHEKTFGSEHPYGYKSTKEKYEAISCNDIKQFFNNQYSLQDGFVLLAGNFSKSILNAVLTTIENIQTPSTSKKVENFTIHTQAGKYHNRKVNEQQASIRIGMPTISIQHPDFQPFHLLNTVLGGYFGSRLMSNLREEKGFTYGVYSFLGSFLHQGYFYIGTDVGVEQAEAAVNEIYNEMELLKNKIISDKELQLVKNYVMGKYLAKIDGPFAQAKVFQSLLLREESAKDFVSRVQQIQDIKANQLQELANRYLTIDKMVEVVV